MCLCAVVVTRRVCRGCSWGKGGRLCETSVGYVVMHAYICLIYRQDWREMYSMGHMLGIACVMLMKELE